MPDETAATGASAHVAIELDGRTLAVRPGQSVAAALIDHGVISWRTTRHEQRPRGLFCGIGICFDCLIAIDGVPDQRACLVPVAPGMRVATAACSPVIGDDRPHP